MHLVVYTEAPAIVARVASSRSSAAEQLIRPVRGKSDLRAFIHHLQTIRRLRPDVFHVNLHTSVAARYTVLAALLLGLRVVVVEQLATLTPPTRGQKILKRLTARRLAAHVAVGERAARSIETRFGLRPDSIGVIHNAVPDLDLHGLPRTHQGFVIGSVGRLDRQKGYDVLLHALVQVPGVNAVLVGDGPERDALLALADSLGIGDRLAIAGWRDDVREQLAAFDAFVLPSRFEGFPLALLEAMLVGLPVGASDVGSVVEV